MEVLEFLFKFFFGPIELVLIFNKLLILNVLFKLNSIQLFLHLVFLLDLFSWLYPLNFFRNLKNFFLLDNFWLFLFYSNLLCCFFNLCKLLFLIFLFLLNLMKSSLLGHFFSFILKLFFDVVCQLFIVSLDFVCQHWRSGHKNAV